MCADLSIEGEGKGGFGEGKRGKVPANISGHRLYAKHRAGVVTHTHKHTHTHTRDSHVVLWKEPDRFSPDSWSLALVS